MRVCGNLDHSGKQMICRAIRQADCRSMDSLSGQADSCTAIPESFPVKRTAAIYGTPLTRMVEQTAADRRFFYFSAQLAKPDSNLGPLALQLQRFLPQGMFGVLVGDAADFPV